MLYKTGKRVWQNKTRRPSISAAWFHFVTSVPLLFLFGKVRMLFPQLVGQHFNHLIL